MFDDGQNLIWNADVNYQEENISSSIVTYMGRTGANTAIVQRDDVEFEVFLDELEFLEQ
tara:strand:- start:8 stop:184 length:177 start_codon:yes stop_codon:yes gene_type:complete